MLRAIALTTLLIFSGCAGVEVKTRGNGFKSDYSDITAKKPDPWTKTEEEKTRIQKWEAEDPKTWRKVYDRNHALETWGDKNAAILEVHNADARAHNAILLEELGIKSEKDIQQAQSALDALKKKKGVK